MLISSQPFLSRATLAAARILGKALRSTRGYGSRATREPAVDRAQECPVQSGWPHRQQVNGVCYPNKIAYLIMSCEMIRIATAVIAVLSVLSTPIASAICTDCCPHLLEHQVTVCHDKAHAHLGPHIDHMNHVHMVTRDSDASVVIQQCDHQFQNRRLSCQSVACLSAKPVQASVASVPANQLPITSQLPTITIGSSLPPAQAHPPSGVHGKEISSHSLTPAPLRI